MNRPPLEVADLVRAAGRVFIERSRRWITWQHLTVLRAIARCRTAALGGHLDECIDCGYRPAISYNSCRNRHCPKCQANARARWLQARRQELLPTRYVHVVFTLPRELAPLALQNKKLLYHLLLQTSAATLLAVARDPKHLGAEIGFFSVLHTWNQKLEHHPHVHCVVPAGGLSLDRTHWIQPRYPFFLPVKVLSRVFRGKFVAALKRNFRQGKLGFHGNLKPLAHSKVFSAWIRTLFRNDWHVYSKRPFESAEHALCYLGHYTHRVAISNHRLVSFVDDQVTFRWRDSAHNNEHKLMTLALDEFLRRFLLHLLPKGFVRIRHFGFLANRRRATLLPLCFQLLGAVPQPQAEQQASAAKEPRSLWRCPKCGGPMIVIERRSAAQLQRRSPPSRTGAAA
jgi:predicted RNA-binding Zn-ribbon protein involved in translation (DUF1610 family)